MWQCTWRPDAFFADARSPHDRTYAKLFATHSLLMLLQHLLKIARSLTFFILECVVTTSADACILRRGRRIDCRMQD